VAQIELAHEHPYHDHGEHAQGDANAYRLRIDLVGVAGQVPDQHESDLPDQAAGRVEGEEPRVMHTGGGGQP